MYEWNYAVQEMIDWIEANISTKPTLEDLAKQVGYSNFCLFPIPGKATLNEPTARVCRILQ